MSTGSGVRTVVLASGAGSNLRAIIDAQRVGELPINVIGVLSDRPAAGALDIASQAGIETRVVPHGGADFQAQLARAVDAHQPELVVLAGFMRILDAELVQRYRGRLLNVHPSLLPRHPGLRTHRRVLEAGDPEHGSTVHFVIPALDAGPAILQYRLRVHADDTEATLRARVQAGEWRIYPRAIGWCASGRARLGGDGVAMLDGVPLITPPVVEEAPAVPGS